MYFRHPEQLAKLLERPELGSGAVEELLRYITPTQRSQLRLAIGAIEEICPGDAVLASLYAANHYPDVFKAPEEFDIQRDARGHVAFGYGPHQCIGQPLARLERFRHLRAGRVAGHMVVKPAREDQIEVHSNRCIGAGNCADTAPKYFGQSEEDGPVLLYRNVVDSDDRDDVARAAALCPMSVIELR
jgi:ferredoxin